MRQGTGKRIYVQDVAVRDGFQNERDFIPTEQKIALITLPATPFRSYLMKLRRIPKLMIWAIGLATCGGIVSTPVAHAQTEAYPSRAIMLIVPSAAGGTTDLSARMISEPLSKALGQQVVVDNRPGGNGTIATSAVARAKPDGYTLLMQYSGYHVITPAITKQS